MPREKRERESKRRKEKERERRKKEKVTDRRVTGYILKTAGS